MTSVSQKLRNLLEALPAILLVTFVEVIICFAVGALVMLELMPNVGRNHPNIVLWVSAACAFGTQAWIMFNHKIRKYIKSRSNTNE